MEIKTYQITTNIKAVLISEENGFEWEEYAGLPLLKNKNIKDTTNSRSKWKEWKGWWVILDSFNGCKTKKFNKTHYLVWSEENENDKRIITIKTFKKNYEKESGEVFNEK